MPITHSSSTTPKNPTVVSSTKTKLSLSSSNAQTIDSPTSLILFPQAEVTKPIAFLNSTQSPLHTVDSLRPFVQKGDLKAIQEAIDNGFSVNSESEENSTTLLHWCAEYEQPDIANLLLEQGADVNKGLCGTTPLMTAAKHGKLDMVKLFLTKGASVRAKQDIKGKRITALQIAQESLKKISGNLRATLVKINDPKKTYNNELKRLQEEAKDFAEKVEVFNEIIKVIEKSQPKSFLSKFICSRGKAVE